MELEVATDATVGTDRLSNGLLRLVPGSRLAMIVLRLEHQSAGGTYRDTVATIDTRRIGQLDREFSRNPSIEAAACYRQRVGVLKVFPTGLDTLVAEDALAVIAYVELVVHLGGLSDRGAIGRIGRRMMARLQAVSQSGR